MPFALGHSCHHPPLHKPPRWLGATLWAREERPCPAYGDEESMDDRFTLLVRRSVLEGAGFVQLGGEREVARPQIQRLQALASCPLVPRAGSAGLFSATRLRVPCDLSSSAHTSLLRLCARLLVISSLTTFSLPRNCVRVGRTTVHVCMFVHVACACACACGNS